MAFPYYSFEDILCGVGGTTTAPVGGVWKKLSQRYDVFDPQEVANSVLEISQSLPVQGLQRTTTTPVQMTSGQYQYPFSTWVNAGDIPTFGTTANPKLVPSFYMFYNVPLAGVTGYNPGIGLTWKSIDSLELMFSTPGTPAYWTRFNNNVFIAPQPNNTFYSYMRYQIQHPFSKPAALTDMFYLDDDMLELATIMTAQRIASNLRMLDYATQYHSQLYGDPKKPGDLGLFTARVTQLENDIVSNQGMRQIRPMNWRVI